MSEEQDNKPFDLPYENSHGDSTLTMKQLAEDRVECNITDGFQDSNATAVLTLEEAKKLHAEFEDMEGDMAFEEGSMHSKYFPETLGG